VTASRRSKSKRSGWPAVATSSRITGLLKTAGAAPDQVPRPPPHMWLAAARSRGITSCRHGDLGHSAIAVTMKTYGDVMPLTQREAADRMNELFV
jgi:hypothetical protein